MGIMSFFGGSPQRRDADPGDGSKKDDEGVKKGGNYTARIVNTGSEETALTVGAVYRAADLRSSALAGLKIRYLIRDRSRKYMAVNMDTEGRNVNYVLGVRPNSRQNAFQFWKQVELSRIFFGHAYILPRYDCAVLRDLVLCKGDWDPRTNLYTLYAENFGISGLTVDGDDLIVLRNMPTDMFPQGESILHYAARTTSVSATAETLTLEGAAKGGRQKLILSQEKDKGLAGIGGLDPEEMKKQAKQLQESIMNDDVIYNDSNGTVTPINMSMADLQLLESRKFTVADIARFFSVPRTLLMDDSNSNYKSAEAASLEFLTRTLQPLIREIECELDSKLLSFEEFGERAFQFDTSGLFALDIASQSLRNKSRLETGLASVNELRAEENMPAIEDGDEHYVSCNVAPVGSPKLSGSV